MKLGDRRAGIERSIAAPTSRLDRELRSSMANCRRWYDRTTRRAAFPKRQRPRVTLDSGLPLTYPAMRGTLDGRFGRNS